MTNHKSKTSNTWTLTGFALNAVGLIAGMWLWEWRLAASGVVLFFLCGLIGAHYRIEDSE